MEAIVCQERDQSPQQFNHTWSMSGARAGCEDDQITYAQSVFRLDHSDVISLPSKREIFPFEKNRPNYDRITLKT